MLKKYFPPKNDVFPLKWTLSLSFYLEWKKKTNGTTKWVGTFSIVEAKQNVPQPQWEYKQRITYFRILIFRIPRCLGIPKWFDFDNSENSEFHKNPLNTKKTI